MPSHGLKMIIKGYMMISKEKKITIAIVSTIILLITIFCIYMYPVWVTTSELKVASRLANNHDQETGETGFYDYWNNRILLLRENNKEENYIKYTAYSAGRDEKYYTDDDIHFYTINVNWSKRAGSAAGKMATEAIKGFKETFKKDSRHDKE